MYNDEIDKQIIQLLKSHSKGLLRDEISELLDIPRSTIYDHYNKGKLKPIIETEIQKRKTSGRRAVLWKLKIAAQ